MILIFKYVFVCVCWVSPWDALHGWGLGESTILHQATPLRTQVWSQPWFGLCRAEGTDWGDGMGSFPTHYISQGEQVPLGSSGYCPADRHVPQERWKCPNSCFYWPWDWANALREKPLQIDFFSSPSLSAFLVDARWPEGPVPALAVPGEHWQHHGGTWGDLKALYLPWLFQRSTGSTTTHQGPSATAL